MEYHVSVLQSYVNSNELSALNTNDLLFYDPGSLNFPIPLHNISASVIHAHVVFVLKYYFSPRLIIILIFFCLCCITFHDGRRIEW